MNKFFFSLNSNSKIPLADTQLILIKETINNTHSLRSLCELGSALTLASSLYHIILYHIMYTIYCSKCIKQCN